MPIHYEIWTSQLEILQLDMCIYVDIFLLYISVGIYTHLFKQMADHQQTAKQMCDSEAVEEQQLWSQQFHSNIHRVQSQTRLYYPCNTAVWT